MTTGSDRPARRTIWTLPSSRTHQKSAGSPSLNSSSLASNATFSPTASEIGQLLVGQPVEEEDRAELVDQHQIVAR